MLRSSSPVVRPIDCVTERRLYSSSRSHAKWFEQQDQKRTYPAVKGDMKLKKETPPPVRQLFLVEKRKSFQYATLWEKKRKSFVTKLDVKHCVFNWKTCRSSGNSSASARTMSCTTLFTWTRRGSFLEQPLFFPLSIFYIYIWMCVFFFFGFSF